PERIGVDHVDDVIGLFGMDAAISGKERLREEREDVFLPEEREGERRDEREDRRQQARTKFDQMLEQRRARGFDFIVFNLRGHDALRATSPRSPSGALSVAKAMDDGGVARGVAGRASAGSSTSGVGCGSTGGAIAGAGV